MKRLLNILERKLESYFSSAYPEVEVKQFVLQPTNKDQQGNLTLMVFPLAKIAKKNPEVMAEELGTFLVSSGWISSFHVIKGFLNLYLANNAWNELMIQPPKEDYQTQHAQKIVLEYCGPNTNKPLHIGHLRNMFLGYSVSEILREVGHQVHKVNIFNDRGIQICKSMIAYQKFGNGETPTSKGWKGDFFVGHFYIKFNEVHQQQKKDLIQKGEAEDKAEMNTPIFLEANQMLIDWENGVPEVIELWEKMNSWFYDGVRKTYNRLGIDTEKDYYESLEYKKGKDIVKIGYESGVFQKDETGAISIDLTSKGLDKKYLQRANGTSLYITQDMALVKARFDDYHMDKMIYVVGDEQNYHFKVLKYIMEAMNEPFSKDIYHLSYGLVVGADGTKFKSREGTAADADLIVDTVVEESKQQTLATEKAKSFSETEIDEIAEKVGIGALKYSLLKVISTKNIVFDPKEAVDINGDTGPYVQYTYVRTKALKNKSSESNFLNASIQHSLKEEEQNLILILSQYSLSLVNAAASMDPSEISQYMMTLAKAYNKFYTECDILKEPNESIRLFRLLLNDRTAQTLYKCFQLLGMPVPDKM